MLNKYSKKNNDCKPVHNHTPRFLLLDSTQDVVYIWRYSLSQRGFDFNTQHEGRFGMRNLGVCAKIGTITLFLVNVFRKIKHPFFVKYNFSARAGIANATGWTVLGSNPSEGKIYRNRPGRSWGPPSLQYNGYWVFPGGKTAGTWRWPPTSSIAEVKERVDLYF